MALDGRKWNCEYYVDERTGALVIDQCDHKQTVTIFRCINSVVPTAVLDRLAQTPSPLPSDHDASVAPHTNCTVRSNLKVQL